MLAIACLVLAVALVAATASATEIVVDIGGSGDYTAINPAISAASEGDTILVMPGTYTGLDNKEWGLSGTNVVIRSTDGSATTIIDCEGSNGVLSLNPGDADSTTIIEGFTMTGGNHYSGGLAYIVESSPTFIDCVFSNSLDNSVGGAVYFYDSSSSFTDCVFSGNSSVKGGAVQIEAASPTFTNCQFTSNSASEEGGGVDVIAGSSPVFYDCTFSGNTCSGSGGGLRCDASSATVTECSFIANNATYTGGGFFCDHSSSPAIEGCVFGGNSTELGNGGGLACINGSSPSVFGCTFYENTSGQAGGGALAGESSPTFTSCVFDGNEAEYGGGVLCYESTSTFYGCFFLGNYAPGGYGAGGGLYCEELADVVVTSCTFSDNGADVGGGNVECFTGAATFDNCIIAFSTSGPAINCFYGTEVVTLNCCDVYGNAGGDWAGCIADQESINGNMSDDPLFCDRPGGDYTIDAQSPCAPDNSGGCGLVGALSVACDTPVHVESWGAIKAMFR
jgi:predicted outer membrane repeat protein